MNSPVSNWRQTKNIHDRIGKIGVVVSFAKVHVAPSGFEGDVPYYAGIIALKNGERITIQFVDFDSEPLIGQKVITVVRRIGKPKPQDIIQYGIKIRPL